MPTWIAKIVKENRHSFRCDFLISVAKILWILSRMIKVVKSSFNKKTLDTVWVMHNRLLVKFLEYSDWAQWFQWFCKIVYISARSDGPFQSLKFWPWRRTNVYQGLGGISENFNANFMICRISGLWSLLSGISVMIICDLLITARCFKNEFFLVVIFSICLWGFFEVLSLAVVRQLLN